MRVKVLRPTREHLKRVSTPQPAHVEPYEKTEMHAMVSGYLEFIAPSLGPDGKARLEKDGEPRRLDIGDRVNKGQVLAVVSVPQMKQEVVQKAALVDKARAELGQAKAAVQAAEALAAAAQAKIDEVKSLVAKYQADVKYREGEYRRYAGLAKQNAVQGDVVDKEENQLRAAEAALMAARNAVTTADANARVETARQIQAVADEKAADARLQVAQADLKHAEIMVDYATIKAPWDGVITRRLADPGDFIQSATTGKGTPLFSLARVDRLRIVSTVPEAEAGLVKIGQAASFQLHGQPLTGKVVRLADALDSGTRTMRIEVELDAPQPTLRPGMFGSGTTITLVDIPNALTLPASALTTGSKPCVLCVEAGQVQRKEIGVCYNDGVRIQVMEGLTADAQVIADGKSSLREGQSVAVAD
ncbi:MAG: efflux RND transporter periplasmic adaptor subunit [Gemmataceae bacterium]|nr:efflux RND transporter periplasmic adaptor subunit [Gemmataceae bacterium]